MEQQALRFGAVRLSATAKPWRSRESSGWSGQPGRFRRQGGVIASGAAPRPLGCPGEMQLRARGVSYCAVCDAAFYEECRWPWWAARRRGEEALYLTRFAPKSC
jgi:thioredoxin reductase (NADPH)